MWRLLAVVSCFLLAACYGSGKRGGNNALEIHDFGPPATEVQARSVRGELALEVRAPLWMDSLAIQYRLLYAEPTRLREYTQARWAGPTAQMIQQRLMQKLSLALAGQSRSRCVLRVDIDEFSQRFETSEASRGVLLVRVQILDRSRALVAARAINVEKPAPTPDSRGGVAALTATVDQLAIDLSAWENELRVSGKLAGCLG